MSKPLPGETVATVEWLLGDRMMSMFMRNAGLGIQNVGVRETATIRYHPGEVVDEARVLKAVHAMMKGLDDENSKMEITNPKVISIHKVIS